ncbi:MAG: nickel pincer cofactor biosynthesis protein LarC [Planctomycetota bacterium]|nr:MAG: nickel pincer cofactor biosynthesis protein LarC [Planctomycetota bacterium]
MRIAYFDCATGIAGDMTVAALVDAGADMQKVLDALKSLNLPGLDVEFRTVVKGGFRALRFDVRCTEQHAHRHLADVLAILDAATGLNDRQRELARRMFSAVAEAEARVHGSVPERVHFHEVGALDSIADIVGTAVAFDLLQVDRCVFSPIPTGYGLVNIDHGTCPIPAPGTAELLRGVPLADVPIEAELTTPTGAAIVKVLADAFGRLPAMTLDRVGYGAGTADFPGRANVLRVFVGQSAEAPDMETIVVLETAVDDVSPECIGYVREELEAAGALDVQIAPLDMKKNRPGVQLTVLCRPADADRLVEVIFGETATLGIRRSLVERVRQRRLSHAVNTPWGRVRGKVVWSAGRPPLFVPEYEDCAAAARQHGVPLRDVMQVAAAMADPIELQQLVAEHERQSGPASTERHGRPYRSPNVPVTASRLHDHDHDHDHHHDGHGHDHDACHGRDHDHDHEH